MTTIENHGEKKEYDNRIYDVHVISLQNAKALHSEKLCTIPF